MTINQDTSHVLFGPVLLKFVIEFMLLLIQDMAFFETSIHMQ